MMNFRGQVYAMLDKASYEGNDFREDSRSPWEIAVTLLQDTINRLGYLEPSLLYDMQGIRVELQVYHYYDIIYVYYIGNLKEKIEFTLVTKTLRKGYNFGTEIIHNIKDILSTNSQTHFAKCTNESFEAYLRLRCSN